MKVCFDEEAGVCWMSVRADFAIELLIRTTHLLRAAEESAQQEADEERGKAMVFGSFVEMAGMA